MAKKITTSLLLVSTFTMFMGITLKYLFNQESPAAFIWAIGGVTGLIPSIRSVIDELRDKQIGSDLLAVFSIAGALLINEFFAASVISFMLASGRSLENWAEGDAESALKSLID